MAFTAMNFNKSQISVDILCIFSKPSNKCGEDGNLLFIPLSMVRTAQI